jgi:hypothetical protein
MIFENCNFEQKKIAMQDPVTLSFGPRLIYISNSLVKMLEAEVEL